MHHATAFLLVLLVIALASCTPKSPAPKAPPKASTTKAAKTATARSAPRQVEIAGADGVIFPAQAGTTDSPLGARSFTPTVDDVKRFEAGLIAFLRQAKPARSPQLADKVVKGSYKRQYFGTLGKKKERLLRVHFLCSTTHGNWTRSLILVSDGGDCYFELDFDLATGRYLDLNVHGEA